MYLQVNAFSAQFSSVVFSVQYSLMIIVSFLCLLNLIKTLGLLTTVCCGQNRSNLLRLRNDVSTSPFTFRSVLIHGYYWALKTIIFSIFLLTRAF